MHIAQICNLESSPNSGTASSRALRRIYGNTRSHAPCYTRSIAVLVLWLLWLPASHRITGASSAVCRVASAGVGTGVVPSTGACKDLDGMRIHGSCSRQSPRQSPRAQPMTLDRIMPRRCACELPDNNELLVARRALHQSINPSSNQSSHTGWECDSRARTYGVVCDR